MSVFFGEIRQLGYVVPDIEAAMDYWSRVLGVGPFFYAPRVPVEKFTYKGEPRPHHIGRTRELRSRAGRVDPAA